MFSLGTKTVVDMCIENGVRNLIYISCASVVMGHEKIVFGTEENTSYPKDHLFEYAATICEAEKIVLQAHGEKTYRGLKIKTYSLGCVCDWEWGGVIRSY